MWNPLDPVQVLLAREKFESERVAKTYQRQRGLTRAYTGLNYGPPLPIAYDATGPAPVTLVGGDQRTDRNAVAAMVGAVAARNKSARDAGAQQASGVLKRDAEGILAAPQSGDAQLREAVERVRTTSLDAASKLTDVGSTQEEKDRAMTAFLGAIRDVDATLTPPLTGLLAQPAKQFSRTLLEEVYNTLASVYQTVQFTQGFTEATRGVVAQFLQKIKGLIISANLTDNPSISAFTPGGAPPSGVGKPTAPTAPGFSSMLRAPPTAAMPGSAVVFDQDAASAQLRGLQSTLGNFTGIATNLLTSIMGLPGLPGLPQAKAQEAPGAKAVKDQKLKRVRAGSEPLPERAFDTALRTANGVAPSTLVGGDSAVLGPGLAQPGQQAVIEGGAPRPNAQPIKVARHYPTRTEEFVSQQMDSIQVPNTANQGAVTLAAMADARAAPDDAEVARQAAAAKQLSGYLPVGEGLAGIVLDAARAIGRVLPAKKPGGAGYPRRRKAPKKGKQGGGYYGFEPAYDFNTSQQAWRNQMPASALGQEPETPPHSMVQPYTGLIGREPGKVDKYRPSKQQLSVAKEVKPTGVPIVDEYASDVEDQEEDAVRAKEADGDEDDPETVALGKRKPSMRVGDAAAKIRGRQARTRLSSKKIKLLSNIKESLGRQIE